MEDDNSQDSGYSGCTEDAPPPTATTDDAATTFTSLKFIRPNSTAPRRLSSRGSDDDLPVMKISNEMDGFGDDVLLNLNLSNFVSISTSYQN